MTFDEVLNEEKFSELRAGLSDLGYGLFRVHETGSTNDWALEECGKDISPAVFLADVQTNGKGRLGRAWEASEGASLTFSVLIRPECSPEAASGFTEVFGLSACSAIRRMFGCDALIKWPNDIVASGKKICGILTEASPDLNYIVIGAGINLTAQAYPEDLAGMASSIEEVCGYAPDRTELILGILRDFEENRKIYLKTESMEGLKELYESLLVNIGRTTSITDHGAVIRGRAAGIDEAGRLIFIKDDGEVAFIGSGEASVSGIY